MKKLLLLISLFSLVHNYACADEFSKFESAIAQKDIDDQLKIINEPDQSKALQMFKEFWQKNEKSALSPWLKNFLIAKNYAIDQLNSLKEDVVLAMDLFYKYNDLKDQLMMNEDFNTFRMKMLPQVLKEEIAQKKCIIKDGTLIVFQDHLIIDKKIEYMLNESGCSQWHEFKSLENRLQAIYERSPEFFMEMNKIKLPAIIENAFYDAKKLLSQLIPESICKIIDERIQEIQNK